MEIFKTEDAFLKWKAAFFPDALYSHTSTERGYTSKQIFGVASPYSGKYGRGFTLIRNFPGSSSDSVKDYYLIPRCAQ